LASIIARNAYCQGLIHGLGTRSSNGLSCCATSDARHTSAICLARAQVDRGAEHARHRDQHDQALRHVPGDPDVPQIDVSAH
jgi:hypothetical protein